VNRLYFRVISALLAVFAYVALHEGGHALTAIVLGRTVTEVSLVSLKPHVVLQGQATTSEQAIVAAGGSGVVILLWFAFMLLRGSYPVGFLTNCASFLAGIEMLAWFVSSCVHTFAPPNNDVTKFITLSGADPALVAVSVGAMALLAATVYARRCSATLFLHDLLLCHAVKRAESQHKIATVNPDYFTVRE
jgi:hypothetical protein